jgi:hypothetical protein
MSALKATESTRCDVLAKFKLHAVSFVVTRLLSVWGVVEDCDAGAFVSHESKDDANDLSFNLNIRPSLPDTKARTRPPFAQCRLALSAALVRRWP